MRWIVYSPGFIGRVVTGCTVINIIVVIGRSENFTEIDLSGIKPVRIGKTPGSKGVTMTESKKIRTPDYGCNNRCVLEYVDCVEQEDGASICKTRERNCLEECSL